MTPIAASAESARIPPSAALVRVRRWLLYLVVGLGAFYWSPLSIGGLSVRPFEMVVMAWALVFFATIRIPTNAAVVGLFAMGVSLSVSLLIHGFSVEGILLGVRYALALVLVAMITAEVGRRREVLEDAVTIWFAGAMVIISIGIVTWVLAIFFDFHIRALVFRERLGYRAQSFVLDPNRFANFSGSVFATASVLALVGFRSTRAWLGVAAVAFVGLLTTQSRGALLAAVTATLAVAGWAAIRCDRRRRKRVTWSLLVGGAMVLGGLAYLLATSPSGTLLIRWSAAAIDPEDTFANNIRFQFAAIVLDRVFESPVAALFGIEEYSTVEGSLGVSFNPHNTYLSVLAAQGLLGLGVFLTFMGTLLVRGLRSVRPPVFERDDLVPPLRLALLAGFLTILIHELSIVLHTTGFAWVVIALYTASLAVPAHPSAAPVESRG